MPSAFVKDSSGTWKHVKQQFVKVNDRWEPVKNVWIKENNTWKLGYSQSTGSVVYNTPTLGGIFKVPDDIYEIKITYPDFVNTANNYVSTRSMTVTPGSTINYSIGDYGQMSSFGDVAVASFDQIAAKWAGDLDWVCTNWIGLVTGTNALTAYAVGTAIPSDLDSTQQQMASQGVYFDQNNSKYRTDFYSNSLGYFTCSIYVSTVPPQFIQGPIQAVLTEAPVINGGTTIIEKQPTKENNYTVRLLTTDPGAKPDVANHYYQLNLRQVMPITVSWGDWPPEDLYPVSATIQLISVNGNSLNPSARGGDPIVYSMTTTNFTSGTLYYSVSPVNVSIFDNVIASVSGNFTGTSASGVLHTSFGEINVVNSRADTTFTIAASPASFKNIKSNILQYSVKIYKDQERTDGGFLAESTQVLIIPPAGSIIDESYCGGPYGRFGGTLYTQYTVVANGIGGYSFPTAKENSELCGYTPPVFDYGGGSPG
jgi:hypothetical protein